MARIREWGIDQWDGKTGDGNRITDVPGVKVGHVTISNGPVQTGVTAILPHTGNLFREKVLAASHVINGFGKSIGLVQMDELGVIETPILLTNTLSAGIVADGLVKYMLKDNEDIGRTTGTVNAVVGECNDGFLNDIRGGHVTQDHVYQAISRAGEVVEEGGCGAGTGMTAFGLKGGIGTASRILTWEDKSFTLGVLVLANFGVLEDFTLRGIPMGKRISKRQKEEQEREEKGSIIIVIGTDIPMSERQLKRVSKRSVAGLVRVGSYLGNGSGDIAIAFTTANRVSHDHKTVLMSLEMIHENLINDVFRATVDCVEESVLNAMAAAKEAVGRDGNRRMALHAYMDLMKE